MMTSLPRKVKENADGYRRRAHTIITVNIQVQTSEEHLELFSEEEFSKGKSGVKTRKVAEVLLEKLTKPRLAAAVKRAGGL